MDRAHLVRLRPRARHVFASHGRTVLAMDRDGFLGGDATSGLFAFETRVLSRYAWRADGKAPDPAGLSLVEQDRWLGYYLVRPALELRLDRRVANGFVERVALTNYSMERVEVALELEVAPEFSDPEENERERAPRGELTRAFRGAELVFEYRVERRYENPSESGVARLDHAVAVRFEEGPTPEWTGERLRFVVALEPRETWRTLVRIVPRIEATVAPPLYLVKTAFGAENGEPLARSGTAFETGESETLAPLVLRALERAKADLDALRLHDLDSGDGAWTVAAGVPSAVALFGRDTLTTSLHAALATKDLLRGTLDELPRWNGKRRDDWRDEEKDRVLHQASTGPLALLNVHPRARSYGCAAGSALYAIALAQLWHWTRDRATVRPLLDTARATLASMERQRIGGFYYYETRSPEGREHQGWKDSDDAIVDEDGKPVRAPLAPCEVQGYVYQAKFLLAEVLWWFKRRDEAKRLWREARELKERFNEAYWMDHEGTYALALDAHGEKIAAVASNPGHCLATAIVAPERAVRVAGRLVASDLFTGWGVRTLSETNPAYDPWSDHRGSLWPVEQGTFSIGFARYGLHRHVELIARAQFELSGLFEHARLPECLAGHPRDEAHPFPGLHARACSPRAWSASSVFAHVQALLGIYPYAPLGALLVDPHLPDWLPELTLRGIEVGAGRVSLRFKRSVRGRTDHEVLENEGRLRIVRQPNPWSRTATFGERLRDAIESVLP